MANIRAGVAYVDVRLGSIDDLKNKMKAGIEDIGRDAGKRLGDNIKKSTPVAPVAQLGQKLDKELSKAFFKDAKNEFGAGFRALANRDLSTAGALFKSAGKNFGTSLVGGFKNSVDRIGNGLQTLVSASVSAGTAVGNAFSKGITKAQAFGKVLDGAAQKMGFLSFQIQNFGILASAAFTAPVAAAVGFATVIGVKTAASIESATNALKFLLPAGYDVEKLLKRLQKIALDSPIFDTTDLIHYAQQFTAAGVNIDKTTRFLRAFSNIALVTGASTDEANRAVVAITQAFGKGKLQAEELNQQLGEAMPAVMKLLRDELHVTQAELTNMVKEGKISGDDLINIFTRIGESGKFLKGAASGASTLNAVWQNFKESIQTQLGTFFLNNAEKIKKAVDELGPAISQLITESGPLFLKLIDGFSQLVKKFAEVIDWYSKLSPGTQDLIMKILLIGTAVGPVVLVLGSLAGAFAGIVAGIAALLTPVGLVIAGIVLVGAAIAGAILWFKKFLASHDDLKKKFEETWNNFYDKHIGPVVDALKLLWSNIVDAFNQIKNAIGGNTGAWKSWGGFLLLLLKGIGNFLKAAFILFIDTLKTSAEVIGSVIKAIASFISGIIKIFKGLTDFLAGVFTADWSRAWEGIKEIWDGLWDAIYGTLANAARALGLLVIDLVKAIYNFFKNLYEGLVGHSIIPDMVKAIIMWFYKLTSPIRSVFSTISSIVRGFASAVSAFVKFVADGVKKSIEWWASLPGKIKNALSGAASWLYNTGKNIVHGLVNGVKSMAGYLRDAILNLIPGPVRSIVSSALGIGSPSKVFREYGRNVVQGFVLGISGEQRNLFDSLSGFSEKPRFQQINGSPADPLVSASGGTALQIENYYANDEVDPWRQAEDWYFLITSRGGVS